MLTIGVFAHVGQVTIQTLRHYDRLGLLKPGRVDTFTNYRYYTLDQLPRLYRILALKELGLSLEQIGTILDDDISVEQLRGMLKLRRAQLLQALGETQAQLERVEAHIRHIEQEGEMPQGDVILKTLEPMLVAGRRIRLGVREGPIWEDLDGAFRETWDYVQHHNAGTDAPCIAVWYTPAQQHRDEEVEAVYPLKRSIPGSERIQVHELPQEYVASLMHQGDFRLFGDSVKAIVAWIERNGYRIAGPFREVYHRFDRDQLEDTLVELQFPVSKE